MKRYRVLAFDFDTRATILRQEISPDWEDSVRTLWENNQASVRADLAQEFGVSDLEEKLANFVDLGPRPFSVLAFHNRFAAQARRAFVVGSCYPALTGACALGERILNHLILGLRDDYKSREEYKKAYRKDSFDDWQVAIATLGAWGVMLPEAAQAFRELEAVRNRAIHFHLDTDKNDRSLALEAIRLLDRIILAQFPVMGPQPWFIPGTRGESYIGKQWEAKPFIRCIYLPNCILVGPEHRIEELQPEVLISDQKNYPNTEITDEEFVVLRTRFLATRRA